MLPRAPNLVAWSAKWRQWELLGRADVTGKHVIRHSGSNATSCQDREVRTGGYLVRSIDRCTFVKK